jgi:hypothetical protein
MRIGSSMNPVAALAVTISSTSASIFPIDDLIAISHALAELANTS